MNFKQLLVTVLTLSWIHLHCFFNFYVLRWGFFVICAEMTNRFQLMFTVCSAITTLSRVIRKVDFTNICHVIVYMQVHSQTLIHLLFSVVGVFHICLSFKYCFATNKAVFQLLTIRYRFF